MDQSTWTPRHVPGWTLHWDFGGDIGEDFCCFQFIFMMRMLSISPIKVQRLMISNGY